MTFSAYKTLLPPTGVDHCTTGFLTHCPGDRKATSGGDGVDQEHLQWELGTWAATSGVDGEGRLLPNLIVVKANMLEVFVIRTSSGATTEQASAPVAWWELVFDSRLHGNVESLAVLKSRQDDLTGQRTQHDSLVLAFRDAKISVVEWDDDQQRLRTSSLHCFESARWQHLKRGLEQFPRGPLVKADPQGRCAAALLFEDQLLVMTARASGLGFGEEEGGGAIGSAASVEETYFLDLRSFGVKNVKDFVFLHGYLEPALLVLHEPVPTWGGRAAVQRFTCEATVLSVNTTLRQHPQIFFAKSLPYDAYQTVAVPSPLGGALILAANTVHYFSQTTFHTLGLNSFAAVPEGAPPTSHSSFEVELDVARVAWVASDTALVTAKTGMLLLLTLGHDGRTVHSLELTRSMGAVLASSMCAIGDSLFFLGSRLGDSMLVSYRRGTASDEKPAETELEDIGRGEPPTKRPRHADVIEAAPESQDELSLYGTSRVEQEDRDSKKSFSFTVCTTMVNIGPVRDLVIGKRTKRDAEDEGAPPDTEAELVLSSGHGKNGALSLLHQTVRPSVTTEVDLGATCRGIWAVHQDGSDEANEFHSYLVISLEDGTRVLSTGEDIAELDDHDVGFFTGGPTVAVGNLFNRRRILQVHAIGFLLLEGHVLKQEVPLFEFPSLPREGDQQEPELSIASAAICDPFVLFLLSDGTLRVGECDESAQEVLVGTVSLLEAATDSVTAVTLFEDEHGCFGCEERDKMAGADRARRRIVFAALGRSSGRLEIYRLPEFEHVSKIVDFIQGRRILSGEAAAVASVATSSVHVSSLVVRSVSQKARQESSQPYLCASLSSGAVLAYKGFCSGKHSHLATSHLPPSTSGGASATLEGHDASIAPASSVARKAGYHLKWVRVHVEGMSTAEDGAGGEEGTVAPSLTAYEGVNGGSGVFLCAPRPAWMMDFKGRPRPHLQLSDGPIAAFSAFHNVHNPHGFVYVTSAGVLRIAQLPDLVYDAGWPVAKVPLKATPHKVAYLPEPDVYVVAASVPVDLPFSRPPGTPPDEGAPDDADPAGTRQRQGDAGPVYCDLEHFELRVLAPGSWDTLESLPMLRYEHIAAATSVALKNITSEEREVFLSVGTTSVLGEDAPSRGRVLLYRLGKSDQGTWLHLVYAEEHRAGITAVSSVQGCLLAAVGTKLILYRWNGESLVTAAFFDAPMYVTCLNSLKSYVLLGDFQRSVHFLHWVDTAAMAQLRELAKDYAPARVSATAFMNDGKALALVAADFERNIRVFEYLPNSAQLACKAEFHTGSLIAQFLRVEMPQSARASKRVRSACLFGTVDGAIATLAPLDEMTFKRLQALCRRMGETEEHVAGLNPRSFRKLKDQNQIRMPGPENIVDLDLLSEFEMLSQARQAMLGRQVGTTHERVLADINDIRLGTTFVA